MRTLPFVPIAEATFIAGLNDRQMARVVDENLVPPALLGQHGSSRLFARLAAAFARFYFDTEQTLVASARRDIVEELATRVHQMDKEQDVLGLRVMPTEVNWKVARKTIEIDVSRYVTEAYVRAREVDEAESLVTEDPEVMGGMPCFAGTRVPIDMVLSSLDEGMSLAEVCDSYPFLTEAYVASARVYAAVHPRRGRPRRLGEVSSRKRLREKITLRPASA
ncbi:MAG: DUF433 domain-containing protein [Proteobacteria bacterium]|nr:DUF433 domain-containing protein [Pseudomonadota bacterium]